MAGDDEKGQQEFQDLLHRFPTATNVHYFLGYLLFPKDKDRAVMSSEDISSFCGRCHRTWETVVRNRWRGEPYVRFAPYRLANSKCFDGADPRISCLACHDPHQDVVGRAADYDSKCLACHASAPSGRSTSTSLPGMARSCPVAKADCVSCHMPKVKLPDEHLIFTDHWIRVAHPGDPYPD